MQRGPSVLRIYEQGTSIVVGFAPDTGLSEINIEESQAELVRLLHLNSCQSLTFDLSDMNSAPPGLLEMMYSMAQRDVEICVFNPSPAVQRLLKTTRLSDLILEVESLYRESA